MKKEEESSIEKEQKIALEAIKNTPRVSILAGLPEYLKDPKNYKKVKIWRRLSDQKKN